jgi:hypothetical protein
LTVRIVPPIRLSAFSLAPHGFHTKERKETVALSILRSQLLRFQSKEVSFSQPCSASGLAVTSATGDTLNSVDTVCNEEYSTRPRPFPTYVTAWVAVVSSVLPDQFQAKLNLARLG